VKAEALAMQDYQGYQADLQRAVFDRRRSLVTRPFFEQADSD
jgi:hypothetical protein